MKRQTGDEIILENNYKDLPYYRLNQLEKLFAHEAFLSYRGECFKLTRGKLAQDKLNIVIATFFMVLSHEIFHSIRTKFATNQSFSSRTPEKMHCEAGLYIDRGIYGNYVKSSNFNSQQMTINIAEKVFSFQDLTQEEAEAIYWIKQGRTIDVGACANNEFDEDYFEHFEYLCTGRIAGKFPVRLEF